MTTSQIAERAAFATAADRSRPPAAHPTGSKKRKAELSTDSLAAGDRTPPLIRLTIEPVVGAPVAPPEPRHVRPRMSEARPSEARTREDWLTPALSHIAEYVGPVTCRTMMGDSDLRQNEFVQAGSLTAKAADLAGARDLELDRQTYQALRQEILALRPGLRLRPLIALAKAMSKLAPDHEGDAVRRMLEDASELPDDQQPELLAAIGEHLAWRRLADDEATVPTHELFHDLLTDAMREERRFRTEKVTALIPHIGCACKGGNNPMDGNYPVAIYDRVRNFVAALPALEQAKPLAALIRHTTSEHLNYKFFDQTTAGPDAFRDQYRMVTELPAELRSKPLASLIGGVWSFPEGNERVETYREFLHMSNALRPEHQIDPLIELATQLEWLPPNEARRMYHELEFAATNLAPEHQPRVLISLSERCLGFPAVLSDNEKNLAIEYLETAISALPLKLQVHPLKTLALRLEDYTGNRTQLHSRLTSIAAEHPDANRAVLLSALCESVWTLPPANAERALKRLKLAIGDLSPEYQAPVMKALIRACAYNADSPLALREFKHKQRYDMTVTVAGFINDFAPAERAELLTDLTHSLAHSEPTYDDLHKADVATVFRVVQNAIRKLPREYQAEPWEALYTTMSERFLAHPDDVAAPA